MSRDIALWVPDTTDAAKVAADIKAAAGILCVGIRLFDTFAKDGRTSYAFRLVFLSQERTLTDKEVNTEMDRVYKMAEAAGWEVR